MFTRLFTRKTADLEARKRIVELQSNLEEWQSHVEKLQNRLDELTSEHRKLRGRFYASRGEVERVEPETKADVLRRIGYIPGKPAPHRS